LLLWHWSQPVAYMAVLKGYACFVARLPGNSQKYFATIIAARELLYLATTLFAVFTCPVFLLLDLRTMWKETAGNKKARGTRVALYTLTPHNYVALCLANRFNGGRRIFLGLASVQIVADFCSCFALGALYAGSSGDGAEASPAALKIGYSITAAGFLLFFGPVSVAGAFSRALDKTKSLCLRVQMFLAGFSLMSGLLYIALCFVLLEAGTDVFCGQWTFHPDPCNGRGQCYGASQCHCHAGFGPQNSTTGEALCGDAWCGNPPKSDYCTHGSCIADSSGVNKCSCLDGWQGENCASAVGCDDRPDCGNGQCHAPATTTPDDGHSYTCVCANGWKGPTCALGTGCDDEPCGQHGACRRNGGNHTCVCDTGWSGMDACDHPTGCDSLPDCGHGSCVPSGESHSCSCDYGYKGSTCSEGIGCDSQPDCGHGACVASGSSHTCTCDAGWTGEVCDQGTGCDSSPNCGHGSCVPNGASYSCSCNSGWTDPACNQALNPSYTFASSTAASCGDRHNMRIDPGDYYYHDSGCGTWVEYGSQTCNDKPIYVVPMEPASDAHRKDWGDDSDSWQNMRLYQPEGTTKWILITKMGHKDTPLYSCADLSLPYTYRSTTTSAACEASPDGCTSWQQLQPNNQWVAIRGVTVLPSHTTATAGRWAPGTPCCTSSITSHTDAHCASGKCICHGATEKCHSTCGCED
jgi:hypothetical protein